MPGHGIEDYVGIPAVERHQRKKELVEQLESVFSQKTMDEWMKILVEVDVPVAPVKTPEQVLDDPHVMFREMIRESNSLPGDPSNRWPFPSSCQKRRQ